MRPSGRRMLAPDTLILSDDWVTFDVRLQSEPRG